MLGSFTTEEWGQLSCTEILRKIPKRVQYLLFELSFFYQGYRSILKLRNASHRVNIQCLRI